MLYPRIILPQLEKELTSKEIVVITGMRQVGKTTLLRHLFRKINSTNKIILDLDNPLNRKIFEEQDFNNIWFNLKNFNIDNSQKSYIFLDEIQNLKSIPKVVKYLYDHYSVKFFLTGSSSFYLKNLFSESLSGRKIIYEIFPLTFREFLIFKNQTPHPQSSFLAKTQAKNKIAYQKTIKFYDEYLKYGGFPAVVLENSNSRKKQLLEQIFTSYFKIDVKTLADFHQLNKLRDLILLLIPRIGSQIDITKLAKELAISRETIYSYLSFLEQTYFISTISKYSKSIDRQSAGTKKLFLCDTGLANYLGQLSTGQALEQGIFQSLHPHHKLSYYLKHNKEIDFITDGKISLEVKRTSTRSDWLALQKRSQTLKIKQKYIVTYTFSPENYTFPATQI